MLLRMTIDGTLTLFNPSQLNQGSIAANKIEVLAPFSSTAAVSVAFRLPNGQSPTPLVASLASAAPVVAEDNSWNLWTVTMPAPLTQYAGNLGVQIYVTIDQGTLASTLLQIPVQKGVAYVQPTTNLATWNSILTIYNAVLTAKTNAENAATDAIAAKNALLAEKGQPNGIATLDGNGKLTASQKPTYTKADIGLGNVDNTSDANKPISTAQAAVNLAQAGTNASLQQQIDDLKAAPDVVDIVATYQDLLDYDTSKLTDKDIVKVLQDSTHGNLQSYYRWMAATSSWSYIGSISGMTVGQLAYMMEGDDFITVDENAGGTKVAVSIDSTCKPWVVELSGTSGTLSDTDFAKLNTSREAKILNGGDFYEKRNTVSGYIEYTFVGRYNQDDIYMRFIVINTLTKGWTKTSSEIPTGSTINLENGNGVGSIKQKTGAVANGEASFAEGTGHSIGRLSHTEGEATWTDGIGSHAEGKYSWANGNYSHAEGKGTTDTSHKVNGEASHAEGLDTRTNGNDAHAEGYATQANGDHSHAEGYQSIAHKPAAHAEGKNTYANGYHSHAEGDGCTTAGFNAHSEGAGCQANADDSHAQNRGTIANGEAQTVLGKYNVADTTSLVIVGNGASENSRSNAMKMDASGNVEIGGKMTVGAAPTNNMDVATKQYVDSHSSAFVVTILEDGDT